MDVDSAIIDGEVIVLNDAGLSDFGALPMALYFFAFSDNGEARPDEQGTDLSSFDAVKREAVSALFDVIKEVLPDGTTESYHSRFAMRRAASFCKWPSQALL